MVQATFDFEAGQLAKEEGMQRAESGIGAAPLELARAIAVRLAKRYGTTNADAVGEILEREHGIKSLGPAAGSLFRGQAWEFTGCRIVSNRVSNHSRELKVWQLKGVVSHG